VLFLAGSFVYYALRGPSIDLPRSPVGVLIALATIFVLGHLARLAAVAFAWGIAQFWAADVFQERAPHELVDELSPRALGPELRERLGAAVKTAFGLELPRIARTDGDAARDTKARALDEVLALAHAHAGIAARERLSALEARVEGARALAGALLLSAGLVLVVAAHDLFFGREVAHAFSSFSIVTLGAVLGFSALAAVGWARGQARKLALFVLLLVATASSPASSQGSK
jgi:hypothetical protein